MIKMKKIKKLSCNFYLKFFIIGLTFCVQFTFGLIKLQSDKDKQSE